MSPLQALRQDQQSLQYAALTAAKIEATELKEKNLIQASMRREHARYSHVSNTTGTWLAAIVAINPRTGADISTGHYSLQCLLNRRNSNINEGLGTNVTDAAIADLKDKAIRMAQEAKAPKRRRGAGRQVNIAAVAAPEF